jgi:hypothetical protein
MDPPYIYQFPVRWGRDRVDGPQYIVPGATEVKYLYDFEAEFTVDMTRWTIPEEVNADDIDFTWRPDPTHPPYVYHFGDDYQKSSGLIYTVPGATEPKFLDMMPLTADAQPLRVLDIFFLDKNNASAKLRFEQLQARYPHAQKVRYVNGTIDTIRRCSTRSKTNKFWVVSSENNYNDFNFEWHAEPWQGHMTHVFGSQWQKWSDTFLINRNEFNRCTEWCASLEEFPNLNFVKDQQVNIPDDLYDIYYVDHGNLNNYTAALIDKYPKIKSTRFVDSYLETFKRIMSTVTTEYVWIVSSLCDYSKFDFSWQPEPWQAKMIHVFPSGTQTKGDTFYIHVDTFKQQMDQLELLDWFDTINYCSEQVVPRTRMTMVDYKSDNAIEVFKNTTYDHPYTLFISDNFNGSETGYDPCVWSEKDRKIISFSRGNSLFMAPRDAKNYISTQVYDYPYIDKLNTYTEPPLDIIYISNGEPEAERWYEHLVKTCARPVKRIQNVNGRSDAYKAAANASDTKWFFAVFAKIEVNPDFDWRWQPDYFQEPKHYIFHSRNPLNGLEYGHMGVIAYNKQLVLDTIVWGLDFTLSKPHAVVPVLSGTAHYNSSPEMTWRTAFRETIKLLDDVNTTGSIESQHRLDTWFSVAEGENSMWSLLGAKDAAEYWNETKGQFEFLMKSYEWKWLHERYTTIYTPNARFDASSWTDESFPQPVQPQHQLAQDR